MKQKKSLLLIIFSFFSILFFNAKLVGSEKYHKSRNKELVNKESNHAFDANFDIEEIIDFIDQEQNLEELFKKLIDLQSKITPEQLKLLKKAIIKKNFNIINKIIKLDLSSVIINLDPYNLTAHAQKVNSIAFRNCSNYLLTGSEDRKVFLWNLTNCPKIKAKTLEIRDGAVNSVLFSPDGNYCLTGSADRNVNLWNLTKITDPQLESVLKTNGEVISLAISSNGRFVITCSSDQVLAIWNIINKKSPQIISELLWSYIIYGTAFSPDNKYFLTCSTVSCIWSSTIDPTQLSRFRYNGVYNELLSVLISYNGRYAILTKENAIIYDISNPQESKLISRFGNKRDKNGNWQQDNILTTCSSDFQYALTSFGNYLKFWDIRNLQEPTQIATCESGSTSALAYSPNNRFIITGLNSGLIKVWDLLKFWIIQNLNLGQLAILIKFAKLEYYNPEDIAKYPNATWQFEPKFKDYIDQYFKKLDSKKLYFAKINYKYKVTNMLIEMQIPLDAAKLIAQYSLFDKDNFENIEDDLEPKRKKAKLELKDKN